MAGQPGSQAAAGDPEPQALPRELGPRGRCWESMRLLLGLLGGRGGSKEKEWALKDPS